MKIVYYIIISSAILLLAILPALGAELFIFDKTQTTIMFSASDLGLMDIVGSFNDYDGNFLVDETYPNESHIDIVLRSAGIRTSSAALDKILGGEHWFNSRKYPEIRFVSTGIQIIGRRAMLTGNLTLIGRTRLIALTIRPEPVMSNDQRCFDATGTIHLSDFGLGASIPLLDNVQLRIHAVGIRQ